MNEKEKLKQELLSYIDNYEAKKSAWENVKFKTKKDGTQYANMNSAIDGATYNYRNEWGEKYPSLEIGGYYNQYYDDSIVAYWYLDELPNSDERKKAYRPQFFRQVTPKTFEELQKSVADRIEQFDNWIKIAKKELSALDEVWDKCILPILNLKKQLELELCDDYRFYYKVIECIKELL